MLSDKLLQDLISQEKTLYLYSKTLMEKRCQNLLETFRVQFPNFNNYYAVKANSNPHLLKILLQQGMNFDCSSLVELEIVKQILSTEEMKSKVIYTSNYTSREELEKCLEYQVKINLDDISLIKVLKEICDENKFSFPDFLYLRVNPGMGKTNSETKSNILGGPDAKFGIPIDNLIPAINQAKHYGTKNFGLHCMTGSNILEEDYFVQLVLKLAEITKLTQEPFIEYNLGGGLGIPYKEEEEEINLLSLVSKIKITSEKLKLNETHNFNLVMENGRYLMGPCGFLFSEVQVVKEAFGKKFVGLNACMSNLMRPGMYQAYHKIINYSSIDRNEEIYQIVGNLCENNDWFGRDRKLPGTLPQDVICILDVGAHGYSMGFQYNGKLRCAEYLMDTEKVIKIRRKEILEDYLATII